MPASWLGLLWNRVFPGPEPYDVQDVRTFFKREGFQHIQENRVERPPYLVWLRALKT